MLLLLTFTFLLVGLLTLAERRWPARSEAPPRTLNLCIWAARLALQLTAVPFIGLVCADAARRLGLPSLQIGAWPLAASLALYTLAMDLCEYLYHRAQHAIPWLWRRHALHHSDPCMNATTTERHWWGDLVIKAVTFGAPVAALLQPAPADYGLYAAFSLWHYVVHANLRLNFGRWSFLLNCSAYHRLHHARAAEHYGANYAALFPIFDVIAGSYRRAEAFVETGLDEAPRTLGEALAWPPPERAAQRVEASPA
jgi:sterol desaturase/sphingolipid hydroxylase (fatty acid hydroxylase superfamily)